MQLPKARQSIAHFHLSSKILELDVGNIEVIGPSSAITSAVDGVESMQVYYSKYLPGLIYCLTAPVYLFFFRLREISFLPAVLLLAASVVLMPVNQPFSASTSSL